MERLRVHSLKILYFPDDVKHLQIGVYHEP